MREEQWRALFKNIWSVLERLGHFLQLVIGGDGMGASEVSSPDLLLPATDSVGYENQKINCQLEIECL